MDFKALFQKIVGEMIQKDRVIAFALGLVLSILAAVTNLPGDKVKEAVCGAPAPAPVSAPAPDAKN